MSSDGEDFRNAAKALNELGDKQLRTETYKAFRKVAAPLGAATIAGGASRMPKRGGFAEIVARAKMAQSNSTTGRNPGVTMSFKTRPSHDLVSLDKGILRHPIPHTNPRKWRSQRVPKRAFSEPFEAGQPAVARELVRALEHAAQQVQRTVDRERRR